MDRKTAVDLREPAETRRERIGAGTDAALARRVAFCFLFCLVCCLCFSAGADTLVLPARTVRIGDQAFYGNKALDEVILPKTTEYIGHEAFANSSVRYLFIPSSVTMIEDHAFDNCKKLVCLVPAGSYAKKWCVSHKVKWEDQSYVISLAVRSSSVTVQNGETVTMPVSVRPAAAEETLVWTSSNRKICTVSQNGEIFGQYPGSAEVTVSSKDKSKTARFSVTVKANYRAVLFSESTFADGVIKRNRGDVRLMAEMLSSVTGPDGGKYRVSSFDDLVASEVYSKIASLLIEPSRDGDVSMFFIATHGDFRSTSEQLAGRLWCRRKETWLELPTLAKELSKVRGKVIVLLESCGPGAALQDFENTGGTVANAQADKELFDAAVSAFSSADPGLTVYQPKETADAYEAGDREAAERYLQGTDDPGFEGKTVYDAAFKTEKFIVMTASKYRQTSYSIGSDTYNLFPFWMTKGVGTSGTMPADTECGDSDGKLTLKELYSYVYKHTSYKQTPLVYPENSNYVLFLRDQ